MDEEHLIAASGRTITLFSTSQKIMLLKEDVCFPASMKIKALEKVNQERFIVTTDRTFAVYQLSESQTFKMEYFHGAQALD